MIFLSNISFYYMAIIGNLWYNLCRWCLWKLLLLVLNPLKLFISAILLLIRMEKILPEFINGLVLWLNFPFCSLLTAMASWLGLKNRLVLLLMNTIMKIMPFLFSYLLHSIFLKTSSDLLTVDTFSFNLSFLLSALIISAVISKDAISMNTICMIYFLTWFLRESFILPVRKTLTLLLRRSWNSPNTFSKTSIAPFLLSPMNQIIFRLRSIVIHTSFINGIPRSFIMTVQTIILK